MERGAWDGASVAQSPPPPEPKSTTMTARKGVTRGGGRRQRDWKRMPRTAEGSDEGCR
uniref:Uncharacterized protein n=1 Tax=Setaria italica TaxID=4555 RepID=K3ZYY0_SETIT